MATNNPSALEVLYARNAREKESLEERLQNVRKQMAGLALSEQKLEACLGVVTERMVSIQLQLFGEQLPPDIELVPPQPQAEAPELISA